VVVNDAFAAAHRLQPGSRLGAVLNGGKRTFRVVGVALTPEYVFAIGPGQLVPDDRRFGVLWLDRETLAHAYDLDGAFNEALVMLRRGAEPRAVVDGLDRLLAPYGGTGAYPRADQLSNDFVTGEIQQLRTLATALPPVFLGVAAFLLHMVFGRLIATERGQIGLLKAFGYGDLAVGWHYLKFALAIAGGGLLLGAGLGTWLGRLMAELYLDYYRFPFLLFRAGPDTYAVAAAVTLAVVGIGAASAVRRAARLAPAVAMAPPPPPDYSLAGDWSGAGRWLDQPTRMILRRLLRWPLRAALTSLGIAMAMALYIGVAFFTDAMVHMVDVTFTLMQRQDMSVSFAEPRSRAALHDLRHAPGVLEAEPYRAVAGRISHGHREVRQGLLGVPAGARLNRVLDARYAVVQPPLSGLLLSQPLAQDLAAVPGDTVRVQVLEGRRPTLELPVAAVVTTYIGNSALLEIGALNRAMREGPVLSGAYLRTDPAQAGALYAELKATPVVAGVTLQAAARQKFDQMLEENIGVSVLINTLLAAMVALGVVYNAVRIALAERERELASLRVLGFTRGEVSYILLGEIALLTLLALPLGAGLGYAMAGVLAAAMSSDLYRIPFVVAPATFGYAVCLILAAALAAALVVRRRIDRLDLVAVLKTRD
jgi:putative ABC transport system permease protein